MSNMSYCRFHNTLSDLRDCESALEAMQESVHHLRNYEQLLKKFNAMEEPTDESSVEWEDWATLGEEVDEAYDELERVALSDEEYRKAVQLLDLCQLITDTYEEDELIKQPHR